MVVNVQGTGGSGKSTIVKRVMEHYPTITPDFIDGRKRPISYICEREGHRPLFVPGHYEIACGGCDTISKVDDVYALVNTAAASGVDVLFEGIMCQDRAMGIIDLSKKYPTLVIALNTPLADCLASIQLRRDARGDDRPLSTRRTVDRERSLKSRVKRLRANNVNIKWANRDEALTLALEALELC